MTQTLESISTSIIAIAKLLHQKNMLAAADGNISYRVDKHQEKKTAYHGKRKSIYHASRNGGDYTG